MSALLRHLVPEEVLALPNLTARGLCKPGTLGIPKPIFEAVKSKSKPIKFIDPDKQCHIFKHLVYTSTAACPGNADAFYSCIWFFNFAVFMENIEMMPKNGWANAVNGIIDSCRQRQRERNLEAEAAAPLQAQFQAAGFEASRQHGLQEQPRPLQAQFHAVGLEARSEGGLQEQPRPLQAQLPREGGTSECMSASLVSYSLQAL